MNVSASQCFHCSQPLPPRPAQRRIEGATQAFCCDGCALAAEWIGDAGLGDYYRLRSQSGGRVGGQAEDFLAWDRVDLLQDHVRIIEHGADIDALEITVLSNTMHCAACAWLIDKALRAHDGVIDVAANAVTGRVRLRWDPKRTLLSSLLARMAALGYPPYLGLGQAIEKARRNERDRWLLRLGIAGIGAMQAMMFAEALFLDSRGTMPIPTRDFFRWITVLVSSPVVFYSGWPFIAGMVRELRAWRPGKDTLIAGSTLLAYAASIVETVRGGPHVWFDAAVMFVFLLLAARMLEQRTRQIACAQVDALARARPALAVRENTRGERETIPAAQLAVGDVACVSAGDAVPADGCLINASAQFEEALLTGEARAVLKHAGDAVYAGTVCRDRPARIAVRSVGTATRLAQLSRLVEQAQEQKPRLARGVDRIASHFVVALLLLAVLTWFGWRIHDPARAFEVTLALLVISCPCALSLAIPAALAAAHGSLSRLGVLVLRPDALEALATATDIVFDKTGTLSDGQPVVWDVQTFDEFSAVEALRIAAALELDSGHPLARAFDSAGVAPADDLHLVPGSGVEGRVAGISWRLGHAGFVGAGSHDQDGDIWLGTGTRLVARFRLGESPRADAASAIQALKQLGLRVHLASGDSDAAVSQMGAMVGITDLHSRQTPQGKLALVRVFQERGHRVAMVGDGLNDAPVLAGADVSLAMAEGAALAQGASDFVLTHSALARIGDAIALARRARRIVRQNLAWAIGYNVLALPLAVCGLVTPWIAALGMALSSLAVTINSLRLVTGRAGRAPSRPPARALDAVMLRDAD